MKCSFADARRPKPEGWTVHSPCIGPIRRWLDPEQPLANVRTLADTIDSSLSARRFQTILPALFAGLAVALALVGGSGALQELGLR